MHDNMMTRTEGPKRRFHPPQLADRLPGDALARIATELASTADFDAVRLEPDESRRCVRLVETPLYEAWLIAWRPTSELRLHDHGGSIGVVRVAEGELAEAFTDALRRRPLRAHRIPAGHDLTVPAARIHEVWNPKPGTAISIHAYSPPLTAMTFFDSRPAHFLAPLETVQC
jgi:predicted metal-dependent enzyme (double-stranded beta helix superfamily)